MKVLMTAGYGDISSDNFVDFADDAEAQRLIDLKAARVLTDDENKQNLPFVKVGKGKAAAPVVG